jgi:hypothetical protein
LPPFTKAWQRQSAIQNPTGDALHRSDAKFASPAVMDSALSGNDDFAGPVG